MMLFSISEKIRTLLTLFGCGAISFLAVKTLIWDQARVLEARRSELPRLAHEVAGQIAQISEAHAQLEEIRRAGEERFSTHSAAGMKQAEMIKYLLPGGMPKGAVQTMSVDGGSADQYAFTVHLVASFAGVCDYLRWVERDRPNIVAHEMALTPWQNDTTLVHLQLSGFLDAFAIDEAAGQDTARPEAAETAQIRSGHFADLQNGSGDNPIDWGKNPFLPAEASRTQTANLPRAILAARNDRLSPSAAPSPRWMLKGIVARDRRSIAIINQKVLAPGDKIDGYELVEISSGAVTLAKDRQTVVLRLK
jgi:hypothetical protein